VGGGYGDWMELAQDRDRWRALVSTLRCVIPVVCVTRWEGEGSSQLVSTVMNLRVPKMRGIS